ncbi:hypothetical protein OFM39_30840, partial [Escherichia coli]|nr:hypothetical protein [Escherichia coli]
DSGKHKFILEPEQIKKLKNAKKNNTRSHLELKHIQIKKGGFLPIAIAGIEGASALAIAVKEIYSAVTDAKHKKNN